MAATNHSRRPNVVFFFTDDQRFSTIRALGNEHILTPHMDRLVADGAAFTHAHIPGGTCGAVCMPSRAMLHTGRTLFRLLDSGQAIPADHVLLGEHLRRSGYRTFGTGKWHNGTQAYARSFSDGAEIFFGGMQDHWNVPACRFDPTGRYEQRLPRCKAPFSSKEVFEYVADHVHPGRHSSELFCDAAVRFVEEYPDETPFFLYVSFMAPHDPRVMPASYREMYGDRPPPLPANFMPRHPFDNGEMHIRDELLAPHPRTEDVVREHLADYYAMITHLDAQMGRVLDVLEQRGFMEHTVLVLAGDNGLAIGSHGLFGKQNLYDHSVRVPLVFCGPGVPPGFRSDSLVYLLDIFPTLCDLLSLETPASVEGRSLLPILQAQQSGVRDVLYLAYRRQQRGVSDGRYKLIEYAVNGGRHTQLFDLEADGDERVNLAGEPGCRDVLARLRREMVRLRDEWDDRQERLGQAFWSECRF
jgi:arylsulfatase A-like enzyme